MNKRKYWLAATLFLCAGCSKKADVVIPPATLVPAGVTVKNVTYNNYVYKLLKDNCSTCHAKDGSAGLFWLNDNTYANAVQFGVRIKETIAEGSMPPPPRKPFSTADKELLQAWTDKGMP
jgi:hypothetical protein